MTYEARGLRGPGAQDAALAVAWVAALAFDSLPHTVRALFLGAIPIVLVWGVVTLHFPSRVETSDDGITFVRYGRAHRFAWRDVRVRVRRFLVRDRLLVRLEPSGGAARGRYWITDAIDGFEALARELEARAGERVASPSSVRGNRGAS